MPRKGDQDSNAGSSLSRAGLLTKQGLVLQAGFGSLSLTLLPKPGLAS